jgi:hypothetical protein
MKVELRAHANFSSQFGAVPRGGGDRRFEFRVLHICRCFLRNGRRRYRIHLGCVDDVDEHGGQRQPWMKPSTLMTKSQAAAGAVARIRNETAALGPIWRMTSS